MFRLISFAAACLAGSEAIKLTSSGATGEFKAAADGTSQIDWDIDFGQDQLRERLITGLGVSAEDFDAYVAKNGYSFLDSPDWDWDIVLEEDKIEIAYQINGKDLVASDGEKQALSSALTDRVGFIQRLLMIEEIMGRFHAFEEALDLLTEGSDEWKSALVYDLVYFLDLLTSAMGSVQDAVASGVATED